MKNSLTLLLTVAALLFCSSCNASTTTSGGDSEAVEQAQGFVEAQLARCGDSYFGVRKIANDNALYQFKNPKVSVKSQELTQADKQNGIEWKGNSTFTAETWRMYEVTGKWGPWRQGFTSLGIGLGVTMYKQKGAWKFGSDGNLKPNSYEKADCSKLPQ